MPTARLFCCEWRPAAVFYMPAGLLPTRYYRSSLLPDPLFSLPHFASSLTLLSLSSPTLLSPSLPHLILSLSLPQTPKIKTTSNTKQPIYLTLTL